MIELIALGIILFMFYLLLAVAIGPFHAARILLMFVGLLMFISPAILLAICGLGRCSVEGWWSVWAVENLSAPGVFLFIIAVAISAKETKHGEETQPVATEKVVLEDGNKPAPMGTKVL